MGKIWGANSKKRTEMRLPNANVEWQHSNTFWIWDWKIKIRKQRACQKAKVVKYRKRWRGRKKNKCKPLRINSLISLCGRIKKKKKKRISTSDPLSLTLISLFPPVSYFNIFSLYSSHWNTFTKSTNGMNTQGQLHWTLISLGCFFSASYFLISLRAHGLFCHLIIYLIWPVCFPWWFNSNTIIYQVRPSGVIMVETNSCLAWWFST